MQQGTHGPDTMERLLEEWVEKNSAETLQDAHRSREAGKNRRNAGDEDEDKSNHKIRTLPPQKQATDSQTKRIQGEDQPHQNKEQTQAQQQPTPRNQQQQNTPEDKANQQCHPNNDKRRRTEEDREHNTQKTTGEHRIATMNRTYQ